MNDFDKPESWWTRCTSRILPATKSDVKRLEKLIMALKDDLKNGVANLIAANELVLKALADAASGDGLTAAEAQALVDQMNAETAKDTAATGGPAQAAQ